MPKRKLTGCGLPASTLKQFIDLSYEPNSTQAPAGYTIDKSLSDSRVKVYTSNKNSNVIVVHRGSAALSDWIDNALYATTGNVKSSGTYKQHKKKQDAAIAKYGANNIISIGHSRGAKYAEELNKDNPVKEVITYNKAAGFHDVRQKNPSNQTDVKTSRDIVSLLTPLQQSSNNVVTIKQDTLNPHTAHMTTALDTLGDQNLGLEGGSYSFSKYLSGGGPKPKAKPTIPPPLDLDLLRSDAFLRDQAQVGESSDAGMDYGFNYEIPLSTSRGDFTSRGREKKPSVLTVSTPRAKIKGIAVKPTDTPSGLEIANFIESQFIIVDDGTGAVYDKDDNSPLGYWNPVFHIIQEAPLVPSIRPVVGLFSTGKLDLWIEGIKEKGELDDDQLQNILTTKVDFEKNGFLKYVKATLDSDIEKIVRESNEYVNNINTTYWAQPSNVRNTLLKAKKIYALNPAKTIAQENELLLTKFYRTALNYLNKQVAAGEDFFSKPFDEDEVSINDGNGTPEGFIPQEFIDDSLERALLDLFTIAEPQFTIGGKPNHIFLSGIPLYKDIFIPMAMYGKDDYDWSGKYPTKLFWDGKTTYEPNREATLRELVLYLIYNYWRNLDDLTANKYQEKMEERLGTEEGEEEEEGEEDSNEEIHRRYATATPPEGSGIPPSQNFRQQYIKDYKQRKVGGFFDAISTAKLLGPHLLNYMT